MSSEAFETELVDFTQAIIRVNSLSGKEEAVGGLIVEKMKALGYDSAQVDRYGNVIGIRRGKHPGPTILFDGHMDVVPVTTPEAWSSDPFGAQIREGKIWGRGASDMKGPLAAAVVAIGHVPAEEIHGTIVVSGSVCEEYHEGAAVQKVVEQVLPDFVVICEPNGNRLGIGQKGRAGLWLEVSGKPAHSSVPHLGENAIYKAVPIIERLRRMPLPCDPFLGNGVMELIDAISGPYPSRSTLPVSFRMRYDRRLMQGETMDTVLESIHEALRDLSDWQVGFSMVHMDTWTGDLLEGPDFHPGWLMEETSPWVVKAGRGLTEAGVEPVFDAARFCTNGSYTAGEAKLPTIIFGPSSGMLAHCIDENIGIDELCLGAQGYMGLAKNLGR
ncbi:acetylornithine deacetylase/Succinyl-diaminopimelate desuccinylase [Longilinea arvoryzae]|uniref:Acetylornithine deacetylase/Succinyl-diaminopimelate desuccinylase n=1 Tax=Longilinea arvoryzae TaxID=360412 RepID=A0A0S7B9F0_9CHLR|nr:YgeY family selenium metabolism-linked hydrolase [Longilinea arvoryzae]GAP13991.1 acetylornithine deacetylase/Succinyl-diaminopimelate desuccinylase [Longilinea arvoryzae]